MTTNDKNGNKHSFKKLLRIFFCGTVMGAADVVPGVSGGTMAFILGIYNELLDSIKQILSPGTLKLALKFKIRKMFSDLPWPFLLCLGLGIISAILLFSTPIAWMLKHRLALILAFFFGLVLGSAATVWNKVSRWSADRYIALVFGAAIGFILVGLPALSTPPEGKWYLIVCGAVAISAMILPGISGSFMLLLMGRYQFILDAVNQLKKLSNVPENLSSLLLFGVGLLLGISVFVRFLSWLLRKFHDITVAVLIGFMLGSLRKVWPWKEGDQIINDNILPEINTDFFIAVILAVTGFILVLAVEYAAKHLEKQQKDLS